MRITSGGSVGIGVTSPGGQFELSLDQGRKPGTNTWTIVSDARLKNIEGAYAKGLREVLQLKPIVYHYKNTDQRTFSAEVLSTLNVGFAAQEVQRIFPEAVGADADGYLNFNMHSILVAYANAFKEQQEMIQGLKAEVKNIKSAIQNLTSAPNLQAASISIHELELASNAVLFQNFPNPFGEGSCVKYFVPDNYSAQIVFFDEFGNKLKEFTVIEKGMGQLNLTTINLASGVYSYSLIANGKVIDTKKMIKSK